MGRSIPMSGGPSSRLVPYIPGEDPAARHDRRKTAAEAAAAAFEAWLAERAGSVERFNDNHHWAIVLGVAGKAIRFDWWPSTGRFVERNQFDNPLKFHDVEQVQARMQRWLDAGGRPKSKRKKP